MTITAGIVSYNPDITLLEENIKSIINQVDHIFVVDNGSNNIDKVHALIRIYSDVSITENTSNYGIAKALNQVFDASQKYGAEWVITLDQDSNCPDGFVKGLCTCNDNSRKIGIIAPTIIDRNVGMVGHDPVNDIQEVRTCITSGALTNVNAWADIDGFDEKMFIDSVDFDFCYRLRKAGYKVLQTSKVHLIHSIGDAKEHRFLFWKFNDLEHSAFRDYYIAQNNIYYPKKNKLPLHLIRGNFRNLSNIFVVLLYESDKSAKVKAICRGWVNGYKL
jgi:rhamnosyltransferase